MSRQKGRVEKPQGNTPFAQQFYSVKYGSVGLGKGKKLIRTAIALNWILRAKHEDDGRPVIEHIRDILNSAPDPLGGLLSPAPLMELLEVVARACEKRNGDELREYAQAFDALRTNDPVGLTLTMLDQPHTVNEIQSIVVESFPDARQTDKTIRNRAKELGLSHMIAPARRGAPKGCRRKQGHRARR